MKYYVSEYQLVDGTARTAGTKARADIGYILDDLGYKKIEIPANTVDRAKLPLIKKVCFHFSIYKKWKKALSCVEAGDTLIIQFPNIEHSVLLSTLFFSLRVKKVKVVLFIHDLELIRSGKAAYTTFLKRIRLFIEDRLSLKAAGIVILHNKHMRDYVIKNLKIRPSKLRVLKIFDYIIPDFDEDRAAERDLSLDGPVMIAGNLRRHKSGYVYDLPEGIPFNLYGVDYTGPVNDDVKYFGSFEPEELPYVLSGSFGLVWDGDSPGTCSGALGEYLKINNPHKTSLYLASGIPVIIWSKAALADFVKKKACGITVDSLYDIPKAIASVTPKTYESMKANARNISKRLRDGYYTKHVLGEEK